MVPFRAEVAEWPRDSLQSCSMWVQIPPSAPLLIITLFFEANSEELFEQLDEANQLFDLVTR